MHIDGLPDDVLVVIFHTLVWDLLDSRISLLQTSRRWHSTAKQYARLWTKVSWEWKGREYSNRIVCSSLAQLSQIINLAGNAPFDLNFGVGSSDLYDEDSIARFKTSVRADWASSCRFLRLRGFTTVVDAEKAYKPGELFGPCILESLEVLEWVDESTIGTASSSVDVILERVDATAVRLHTLRVHDPTEPFRYPEILQRLKELHIGNMLAVRTIPWEHLGKLEKLSIPSMTPHATDVLSHIPPLALTELRLGWLRGRRAHLPSDILLQRITHLTLIGVDLFAGALVSLPNLRSFSFFKSVGGFSLDTIDAPNVTEFIFWYPYNEEFSRPLRNATFFPRRIGINLNQSSVEDYGELINVLKVWTDVQELHLRMDYSTAADSCLYLLLSDLKDRDGASSKLKLTRLTVLYESFEQLHAQIRRTTRTSDSLLSLRSSRIAVGLPDIKHMAVGSYRSEEQSRWRSDWIEESMDDPNIEWKECK